MRSGFFKLYVFLIFIAGSIKSQAQQFLASPFPDRIILNWSDDPCTTQSVTWRTDLSVKKAVAQVVLEKGSPQPEQGAKEFAAVSSTLEGKGYLSAQYHSVTFSGLLPDTLYAYRVGDGEHWSEWLQFRTASPAAKPFSFIYLGDAQNDIRSKWSRVIRKAFWQKPQARFIMHAGDLINRSNNDQEWGEWHSAGSFINGMIPSIPSSGNHEYVRNEQRELILDPHWAAQYTLPGNGPEGLKESVYYTDFQNMRIISLNSQMIVLDSASARIQRSWLESVLKDNPNLWTVVTFHHPVFSTAKGRDNKELKELFRPLFDKYHVDLVLQGHDHTYSRGRNLPVGVSGKMGGPVYLVSVAGPKMYKIESERWMDRSAEDTQLFQVVDVNGKTLNFKAYKASGELFDAFMLKKNNKDSAAVFTDQAPGK